MKEKLSIEQVFDNSNTVYKTKASIVLSIVLILAGIGCLVVSSLTTGLANSIISPLFMVLGIIALAWGIISIFFLKNLYRSAASKEKITFSEIFFDIKERDKLIRIITEENVKELKNLKTSAQDALKLRVASTPDGSICYTQVVTYVPFEFVTASEAVKQSSEHAQIIEEIIKAHR